MDIYINSVKADFILENEKTLGDILKAFQIECEKNAATIIAVRIDDTYIQADRMDSVFEQSFDNIGKLDIETVAESDIVRNLKKLAEILQPLAADMTEIPVLFQSGKDARVSAILTSFADSFDALCRILSLCFLFPKRFENFIIDGQTPAVFLKDFSPILSDFEQSLADTDTVLTGDLAEYEIAPRLRQLVTAIQNIEVQSC